MLLMHHLPGLSMTYAVDHTQATITGSLDNLFNNYENRSVSMSANAYFDATYTEASYGSCYKAECVAPACLDTQFSLSVHFSEEVHMHALLMVLDTVNVGTVNSFDIFVIGEDGTETHFGTYRTDIFYNNKFNSGFEAWCNTQGKSFRIVGTPANPLSWDVTICSLGMFGTIYEHQNPITKSVNIQQG